ncbi:acyl carrier protein [Westiellopsis prolifica IICB1]|nr:acyl carrier protein [Westiellopsis prolifica IICB1]
MEHLNYSTQNSCLKDLHLEVCKFQIYTYQICQNWLQVNEEESFKSEDSQHHLRILILISEINKLVEEIKFAVHIEQLKRLKILEKVRSIVVDKLAIGLDKVTHLANFTDDLGVDSLDMVELVAALEEAFNIEISEQVANSLLTVKQATDYICQKVECVV